MKRKGYGRTPRAASVFAIRLLPPAAELTTARRMNRIGPSAPRSRKTRNLPICGCCVRRVGLGRIMCRCRAGRDHASHCLSPAIDSVDPHRGRDPAKTVRGGGYCRRDHRFRRAAGPPCRPWRAAASISASVPAIMRCGSPAAGLAAWCWSPCSTSILIRCWRRSDRPPPIWRAFAASRSGSHRPAASPTTRFAS